MGNGIGLIGIFSILVEAMIASTIRRRKNDTLLAREVEEDPLSPRSKRGLQNLLTLAEEAGSTDESGENDDTDELQPPFFCSEASSQKEKGYREDNQGCRVCKDREYWRTKSTKKIKREKSAEGGGFILMILTKKRHYLPPRGQGERGRQLKLRMNRAFSQGLARIGKILLQKLQRRLHRSEEGSY